MLENESVTPEENETEVDQTTAEVDATAENSIDSDKVVEKLQKRLGKETSEKKETQEQLSQALARIEELETTNKKGVKEQSDEEKALEVLKDKEAENEQLKSQLKLQEVTLQVDEVLKESGFALNKEELALVVNSNEEVSYSNVKTLINLINKDREQQAIRRNTGTTPKSLSNKGASNVTAEQFNRMTYAEKAELAKNNPTKFKEITGG